MEDLKNKCIQLVEAKSTHKKKNEQRSDPIVRFGNPQFLIKWDTNGTCFNKIANTFNL